MNPEFVDRISEGYAQTVVKIFQKLQQIQQVGLLLRNMIRNFSNSEIAYDHLAKAFLPFIYDILKFKVYEKMPLSAHVKLDKTTEEDYLSVRLFL